MKRFEYRLLKTTLTLNQLNLYCYRRRFNNAVLKILSHKDDFNISFIYRTPFHVLFPWRSLPSGLFDDLKNLDTLNLQNTGLTTLPQNLFYPLLSLTTLNLGQNSWLCDCSLAWLEQYLTSSGTVET